MLGQIGACSNPKWLDVSECIEAELDPGRRNCDRCNPNLAIPACSTSVVHRHKKFLHICLEYLSQMLSILGNHRFCHNTICIEINFTSMLLHNAVIVYHTGLNYLQYLRAIIRYIWTDSVSSQKDILEPNVDDMMTHMCNKGRVIAVEIISGPPSGNPLRPSVRTDLILKIETTEPY